MKRFYIMLCTAVAAMLSFACTKAEQKTVTEEQETVIDVPEETVNPDGTKTITIKISAPVTEAQWADGEGFTWDASEGTQFGFFTDANENVQSASTAIDGKDITVTATVDAGATKAFLYYPYANAYEQGTSDTSPRTWFQLLGMAEQTQAAAGSFEFDDDGFGNIALVSSAMVDLTSTSSPFTVSMTPIVSIVRLIPYSSTGLSASVKSITLTADDATVKLNGQEQASFNFSTGEIGTIFSAAGSLSNKVTLTTPFSLSGITSASASKGIYMTTQPTVITGYTITVKMDDASEYKFSTASGLTLAAGQIKNIPLDLDNATDTPTSPSITVASELINVTADATSANISITAKNLTWTATPSSGVTLSSSSKTVTAEETTVVTASFDANETASPIDRTVTITNDAGLGSIVVTIKQAASGVDVYTYTLSTSGWNEGSIKASGRELYYGNGSASGLEGQWVVIAENLAKNSTSYTAGATFPSEDKPGFIKTILGLSNSDYSAMSEWLSLDVYVLGAQWIVVVEGYTENTTGSERHIAGDILNSDGTTYTTYRIQQNP